MRPRSNTGLHYWPTTADEYHQPRLPGTPAGELGRVRLIPAMEIGYTEANAPLFAGLETMQEAAYLDSEYGECGDMVRER